MKKFPEVVGPISDDEQQRLIEGSKRAPAFIKKCPCCGKTFTALTWKLLVFAFHMDDNEPADPEHPEYGEPQGLLEFRNCECGSTICIALKEGRDRDDDNSPNDEGPQ